MALEVYLTAKALGDIDECRQWWSEHRSAEQAVRWHKACERAIESLSSRAASCPRARETRKSPVELRQLTFGVGNRRTHRAVFTIRSDKIVVYRVRHLAQRDLSIDDL